MKKRAFSVLLSVLIAMQSIVPAMGIVPTYAGELEDDFIFDESEELFDEGDYIDDGIVMEEPVEEDGIYAEGMEQDLTVEEAYSEEEIGDVESTETESVAEENDYIDDSLVFDEAVDETIVEESTEGILVGSVEEEISLDSEDEHDDGDIVQVGMASGTCGSNLSWTLDDEGVLTISGTGAMNDWTSYKKDTPWYAYNSSIKKVVIESGVTSIGKCAFHSCNALTSMEIPDSVTCIGDYVAYNCENLSNVTISDTSVMTSIGMNAFGNCSKLSEFIIPDKVTSIGQYAFMFCTSLTSISIPDSMTVLTEGVFYGCESLIIVDLGDGVSRINRMAFSDCTGLETLIIGKNLENVGWSAFYYCDSLSDVYYIETEEEWKKITINAQNECLSNAMIHYNSTGPSDTTITFEKSKYEAIYGAEFTVKATVSTKPAEFSADMFSWSLKNMEEGEASGNYVVWGAKNCIDKGNGVYELSVNLTINKAGRFKINADYDEVNANSEVTVKPPISLSSDKTLAELNEEVQITALIDVGADLESVKNWAWTAITDDQTKAGKLENGQVYHDVTHRYKYLQTFSAPRPGIYTITLSDGTEDCSASVEIEVSDFNEYIYRANNYLERNGIVETEKAMFALSPSRELYTVGTEKKLIAYKDCWNSLITLMDAIDDPSTLIDEFFEKKDYYSVIIFSILENVNILDQSPTFESLGVKDTKNLLDALDIDFRTFYGIKLFEDKSFSDLSKVQKDYFCKQMESYFDEKHATSIAAADIAEWCNRLDNFEKCANFMNCYYELRSLNEANIEILQGMYDLCDDIEQMSLKEALRECIAAMTASEAEFGNDLLQLFLGTSTKVGIQAVFKDYWNKAKTKINPYYLTYLAAYKTSKLISNGLWNTDEVVEKTVQLGLIVEVEDLIKSVYQERKEAYLLSGEESDAKALLSTVDIMYRCFDVDCEIASNFLNSVNSAFVTTMKKQLRRDIADLINTVNNIRDSIAYVYTVIHTDWIYQLETENLGLYDRFKYTVFRDLNECTFSNNENVRFTYTGEPIEPDITIKDGETTLVREVDYYLEYVNNIDVGYATLIIHGLGDYLGDYEKTFEIKHSIDLSMTDSSFIPGGSCSATVGGISPDDKIVSWESSDPTVAIIGPDGTITALSPGTTRLTATLLSGITVDVNITVLSPTINVNPTSVTILPGRSQKVTVSNLLSGDRVSKWSSSASSIATVNNNGLITGMKPGSATITITLLSGKTADVNVTVLKPTIKVSPSSLTLDVGKNQKITVSNLVTGDKVTSWNSADTTIATVNSSGSVTGRKAGSTTVTVTLLSGLTSTINVTVKVPLSQPKLIAAYNGAKGIGVKFIKEPSADSYVIYRKENGVWKGINTVKATDSSLQISGNTLMFTDTSVAKSYGKGFIYSVAAKRGSLVTSYDKTGVAIYRLNPPTLNTVTNSAAGTATVTWKGVFGKTETNGNYDLQYAEYNNGKAGEFKSVITKPGYKYNILSTTVTKLKKGKTYVFRIRCSKTNKDRGTFYSEYSPWKTVKILR